jgi:sugar phosphate isomerase/epimerase
LTHKKLAFSTNAFKKNSLGEAISAIAEAGYSGVELMADVPHAYPLPLDPAIRQSLQKQIKALGLSVSNINGFTLFAAGDTYHPSWIENSEEKRALRVQHTARCIELAAEMNCSTVSLQPGGPMIGTSLDRRIASERFASGLSQLLPLAEKLNVILAVEPEPGLLIQTAGEYLAFKQAYFPNHSQTRMNCDIGHLFCVSEDPAQIIKSMPNEISHVHLEDIGANRVHQHLCPGKGAIDFRSIFAALDEIDYDGWVTVELYPYETTAADVAKTAFDHLRPLLAENLIRNGSKGE